MESLVWIVFLLAAESMVRDSGKLELEVKSKALLHKVQVIMW